MKRPVQSPPTVAAPVAPSKASPAPLKPGASFEQRYPHPRVHRSWPAPQGGFTIIEVYDRSQQAEDPIGTSLWIALADGRKLPFETGTLASVVREQKIVPSTGEQAWAWATLPVQCRHYLSTATIWKPGGPALPGVPAEVLGERKPRSVRKVPGGWDVDFSSVITPRRCKGHGDPNTYILDWMVTIRGSELRFAPTEVWPPPQRAR